MLERTQTIDYETMFSKSKKDNPAMVSAGERPLMKALKEEHAEEMRNEENRFMALTKDEQDKRMLNDNMQ